jgi:voltage-gated potassium channel
VDAPALRSANARCVAVAVVAIVAYVLLPLRGDRIALGLAVGGVLLVLAVPVLIGVVRRVNRSSRPVIDAMFFLIALGTLAILVPAAAYVAIQDISPGSFEGLQTKVDGVYFTVTTIATVGYGDIHAVSQSARMLVTAHILLSIVVLGSMFRLVTRVVGLRVSGQARDQGA